MYIEKMANIHVLKIKGGRGGGGGRRYGDILFYWFFDFVMFDCTLYHNQKYGPKYFKVSTLFNEFI